MERQTNRGLVRRRATGRLLAGVSALALAGAVKADDFFINTAGGDWNTGSNWSETVPPTSGESAYLGYDNGGVTFASPSNVTVTFALGAKVIQSLYSKSNFAIQPAASNTSAILNLRGTTVSFDPSTTISLAAPGTMQFTTASLLMKPSVGGSDLVLDANINEGYLGEVAFGTPSVKPNSVTYGAGYTWNITSSSPGVGGNTTDGVNLDALETPFILNGSINMSGSSSATFGTPLASNGATLTIGSTGKFALNGSSLFAGNVNNQGTLSLASGRANIASFTNGGSFSASGGANVTMASNGGTNTTNNSGSIGVDGTGTVVLLENTSGSGNITVSHSGELDLESFNNSAIDHVSVDSTGIVQIGGTVTTPAGATFDFTRLGSHVAFGIAHGNSVVASGIASFVGGNVIHSDQLSNVGGLTDVTLDHGLTTTAGPINYQTVIGGTVNAGDKPITVADATTLRISPGATLNGDVTISGASTFATLSIGGTLNGNIVSNGNAILALTGNAKASSTITNNGHLEGQMLNGRLLGGSSLDLSQMSRLDIGNFTVDAGASVKLPNVVYTDSSWANAGTLTLAPNSLWIPNFDVDNSPPQPITNSGTMTLPAGATLDVFAGSHAEPTNNSGTFTVAGHWRDVHSDARPVSNTGNLTITSSGEADGWTLSQSAGKTLANGVLDFTHDDNTTPHGPLTLTGGTFAGSGTINWYDATATAGVLLPGDEGSPAQMSFINSTLHLSGSATLKSEIADAAHFGNLAFSGTADSVTLGGTLEVDPLAGSNITYGETFALISADSISGTFDSLDIPQGWQVDYGATSVTVTALPEPAGLSLLLAGALLCRRRRK